MNTAARAISMLACLAAAAFVHGQVPAQKPSPSDEVKIDFSTLDKDADGKLSKVEIQSVADLEGVFGSLDKDNNGSLSSVEFSHWSRAGKSTPAPRDPATAPSGSAGAQHMPPPK